MSLYPSILEMKKLLENMNGWLDKAVAFAAREKLDPEAMLAWRLAPDMFPLVRQIQSACDQAKFAAARTAGKPPPAHPDTEKTLAELRQRIATVLAYLSTFAAEDFAGAAERTVTLPYWAGKHMAAVDYFVEQVQPNFFFHLMAVYLLLRHNGVELGKADFIGALSLR